MSFHSFQYFRQIEMKSVVCIRIQNHIVREIQVIRTHPGSTHIICFF